MSDIFTKAKRSQVMSRIRSRGNKDTEVALAKLFRRNGITGWRRHVQLRVGQLKVESRKRSTSPRPSPQRGEGVKVRPDFVFQKHKLAIFVDGCFWHRCPKHATQPKGNAAFWRRKFAQNIARDQLVSRTLRSHGWRVLRIWEHTLRWATKKPQNEMRLVRRIKIHFMPEDRCGAGLQNRPVQNERRKPARV
jgi:DNA mismatch endonuclease, patch repair protein